MRIIHKGFILVGTPLVMGLICTGSLFALMERAEQQRIKEADIRKGVSLVAREMVAFTKLACLMFVSVQSHSEKITAQFNKELDELCSAANEENQLIRQKPGLIVSEEKARFFRQYIDRSIRFWKSGLDADGRLSFQGAGLSSSAHSPAYVDSLEENTKAGHEIYSFIESGESQMKKFHDDFDQTNRYEAILLVLFLFLNLLMGACLALFYRRSIMGRICVIDSNTKMLTTKTPLLPLLGGSDEIAQLDRSFHEMNKQIEQAAEHERNLFNNASDVICVLDAENKFLRINPACKENWQYEPAELFQHELGLILPADSIALAYQSIDRAKNSPIPIVFEAAILTKSKGTRTGLWSAYWSEADQRLYCIVHDVHERKRIETMRAEFVSLMSSDLSVPLSKISSDVSLILSYGDAISQKARDKFGIAKRNVQRLIELVNDLLQVAEMDSGGMTLKKTETNVSELLNFACQEVELLAREKQILLLVEAQEETLAYVDPNRIIQVLVNLLSNAVKFSAEGKTISVSAERQGKMLVCAVKDRGRGVPEAQQKSIFEKFRQSELADGKRKAGTGLGLPICKQIVEAHGGEIGVTSKPGDGSRFWFSLPTENFAETTSTHIVPVEKPTLSLKEEGGHFSHKASVDEDVPLKKRRRLNLALVGILLVGVPVVFELAFSCNLIWSLIELQHERSAEQHQRDIAYSACKLVNLIAARSPVLMSNSDIDEKLRQLQELDNRGYETQRHLGRLVKGDHEAETYFGRVTKAFKIISAESFAAGRKQTDSLGPELQLIHEMAGFVRATRGMYSLADNLSHIINRAEAREFLSPEKELILRDRQKSLLVVALGANLIVSFLLALQFSSSISKRLAILVDNTGRVAREEPLHPLISGNDELSDLDQSFHRQSTILLESRRKERAVFDNCKDVLCTISPDGLFVSSNPAAAALWGYSQEELSKISAFDLVVPEDRDITRKALLAALSADSKLVHECQMLSKNGTVIHSLWSASARKEQNAAFCTVHDVTDQKNLELLRQEFLALVSHDLRTPLFSITVTVQLAEEGAFGDLPPLAEACLAEILLNSQFLIELINDILDLEKLSAGKMQLHLEPIQIGELRSALAEKLPRSVIEAISLSGDSLEKPFPADKERLCQAIANLFKFLLLRSANDSGLKVFLERSSDAVSITLLDSGPLIPAQQCREIFNRFKDFSLDDGLGDATFRADLRIPLAAMVIECHDGTVHFEHSKSGSNCCRIMFKVS